MTELKTIESRTVLTAELVPNNLEASIRAAVAYYADVYGTPRRVWVNPKDVPADLVLVDGWKIEHRGGCPRGRIMVL
jgi:hypothetical protein